MNRNNSTYSKLVDLFVLAVFVPFIVVITVPFAVVVLFYWLITTFVLYVLVWILWCTRGKDVMFVYSNSPIWHDYIEQQLIPRIAKRTVILNWSERRHWLHRLSLSSLVFRFFGGSREYNPLALHFRPFRTHRTFRFWKAFKEWKHGNAKTLQQVETDLFDSIGIQNSIEDR